jgi:hypothetical protein
MNRLSVILLSCAALLLPKFASAQSAKLEICNDGRLDIDVAVAARIQTFITGYRWKTTGWYTVAAGTCGVVYDEDYDDAGPYTPQSGARVAFTVTRSDGVWGAYQRNHVQKSGWMRSGTGQICVKHPDKFTFERPSGDPAANCGGMLIPVAQDFMPDGPGKFTYTMDWDGDGSFVPLGKGEPPSSVASTNSADSVDNSLSSQFVRALAQAARDASAKRANDADTAASNARGHAAMLEWVREDLAAYIEASRTGFDAYKTGEGRPTTSNPADRIWISSTKPTLAEGCWVVQGTGSRFFCSIPMDSDLNKARSYYTELTKDLAASLPSDWAADATPPFEGNLPSIAYRSTSGAHGQVWLDTARVGSRYTLRYELVAAATTAVAPPPAQPTEDDPIGEGGFITPPPPNHPPMQ